MPDKSEFPKFIKVLETIMVNYSDIYGEDVMKQAHKVIIERVESIYTKQQHMKAH